MTNNEFNVSLFVLFIYSLPCPVLSYFFLYCIARANWSYLSYQYSSNS